MTRERIIRLFAGAMILISLGLTLLFSRWWLVLTAFVGTNLFQSALTGWCLMDDILRKIFHVRSEAELASGCTVRGKESSGPSAQTQ